MGWVASQHHSLPARCVPGSWHWGRGEGPLTLWVGWNSSLCYMGSEGYAFLRGSEVLSLPSVCVLGSRELLKVDQIKLLKSSE